jgi:predicted DsbA family dithiol-disulfide isomerase
VIESLRRRASQFGLDIVLVNIWEGHGAAEEVAGYCLRWDIQGTVLLDESADYARRLGIRGVPTNVFVDERGIVRAVGATTFEDLLREAIRLEPRLQEHERDLIGEGKSPIGFSS